MSYQGFQETIAEQAADGPTLTAAAAASCIHAAAKGTIWPGSFRQGKIFRLTASGRISCAVTTPGTGRFDVRFGSIVVFDSLAFNLNVVAKTNVGWWLDILLTCRTIGQSTTANVIGQGRFTSEANVGAPVPTVGGSPPQLLPISTAPAVGNGFDSTVSQAVDLFWTPSLATASLTCHQYMLESLN